jgi:hypothetical protein
LSRNRRALPDFWADDFAGAQNAGESGGAALSSERGGRDGEAPGQAVEPS